MDQQDLLVSLNKRGGRTARSRMLEAVYSALSYLSSQLLVPGSGKILQYCRSGSSHLQSLVSLALAMVSSVLVDSGS